MGVGGIGSKVINQTFLESAKELKADLKPSDDNTIRHQDKKGVYKHSGIKAFWAGFKNMFRKSDSDHLKERDKKVQAGAEKIYTSMEKTYGKAFAKFAFIQVGSGYEAKGASGDHEKICVPTKVTGGQLTKLENLAKRYENFVRTNSCENSVMTQMAAGQLLDVPLDVKGPPGNPHPNDKAFKALAKDFVKDCVGQYSQSAMNISNKQRETIFDAAGTNGEKIDAMSHDELNELRGFIEAAMTTNDIRVGSVVRDFITHDKYQDAKNKGIAQKTPLNKEYFDTVHLGAHKDLEIQVEDFVTPKSDEPEQPNYGVTYKKQSKAPLNANLPRTRAVPVDITNEVDNDIDGPIKSDKLTTLTKDFYKGLNTTMR